jgi:hypothetical protein
MVLHLYPLDKFNEIGDVKYLYGHLGADERPKLRQRNSWCLSPQPDSHVPEEKVNQHAGQHMVPPSGKLPHLE